MSAAPRAGADTGGSREPPTAAPASAGDSGTLPPRLRALVGRILLAGALASAAIIVVGLLVLSLRMGGTPFTGPVRLPPHSLLPDLARLDPYAVLWLGLLVLVLTPLFRVLASFLVFFVRRDLAFAAMTLFVLAILLASAVGGIVL